MSNTRPQARRPPGFTIMELIIVVVIIGVLAAIAMPSYRIQMLKVKNQEAVRILMVLWEAQKDYYRDNGVYFEEFGELDVINANLDTDIPPPKNFKNIVVFSFVGLDCTAGWKMTLAYMRSNTDLYDLFVFEDGRVVCRDLSFLLPFPICKKMGFPAYPDC